MKFKRNTLELVQSFSGADFSREEVNKHLIKNSYVPSGEYLVKNNDKHVLMVYGKSAKLYKVV